MSKTTDGLSDELRRLLEILDTKGLSPADLNESLDRRGTAADETKQDFRALYDALSKQLDSTQFGSFAFFLNFGYVPDESPQFSAVELPKTYINKNSARLVLEVIGNCALKGKRILDVGCGRGGTIQLINEFFQPASTTGIDLSPDAIRFCQKVHTHPNVDFQQGDAENLPFADASFDVVTNIESSHTYPTLQKFYSEVSRVLATTGYFLYTDLLKPEKFTQSVEDLRELGLVLERDRDVTSNVLRSCDQIALSNARAYRSGSDAKAMQNFLSMPGSTTYEGMKSGNLSYRILNFRKINSTV